MASPAPNDTISVARKQVQAILTKLDKELETSTLSDSELQKTLEELKVLGRNPDFAAPIFTDEGIKTLVRYSFDVDEQNVSREALRCLANALLLNPDCRLKLTKLNRLRDVVERLETDDPIDDFLCYRILFCVTYEPSADFDVLFKESRLAERTKNSIVRFQNTYKFDQDPTLGASEMPIMALIECLKTVFNISHTRKQWQPFEPVIRPVLDIFPLLNLPDQIFAPTWPISHALNVLMALLGNAKLTKQSKEGINTPVAVRLVGIIEAALPSGVDTSKLDVLDSSLTILFGVVSKVYDLASSKDQEYFRARLLPADHERHLPVGKVDCLVSRILSLTSVPSCRNSSNAAMDMLYVLSSSDPHKYVENIGYGFASGYMAQKGIPFPSEPAGPSSSLSSSPSSSSSRCRKKAPVNPITGQRWDAEESQRVKLPPMTKEEKEREAERMFVLFERMKATGVLDVKNPVQDAIDSGRFQEIDVSDLDSPDEDSDYDKGKD